MRIVIKPIRRTLLAAAIAASFSVHAQQAPAPLTKEGKAAGDGKIQQVEVKSAADAYDPRRDDTASKIVVSHDEIVTYGDTSVFDVLKRVSANQIGYQSVRRDLDLYALWTFDPKLQLRVATANLLAQDSVSESSYVLAGNGTQSTRTIMPCTAACARRWT